MKTSKLAQCVCLIINNRVLSNYCHRMTTHHVDGTRRARPLEVVSATFLNYHVTRWFELADSGRPFPVNREASIRCLSDLRSWERSLIENARDRNIDLIEPASWQVRSDALFDYEYIPVIADLVGNFRLGQKFLSQKALDDSRKPFSR